MWLSLVERFVRDEEAAGSNPVTPTAEGFQGHPIKKILGRGTGAVYLFIDSSGFLFTCLQEGFPDGFSHPLYSIVAAHKV